MEKRIKMLFACLFLFVGMAMAQTKVSGTVISSEDGEPVVGATVKIEGTSLGTVTDANGNFRISVPNGKKNLKFSYVGMTTKVLALKENLVVELANDGQMLDYVVVTALGIKRYLKAL